MLQTFAAMDPVFVVDLDSQPQRVRIGETRADKSLNEGLPAQPRIGVWSGAVEHLVEPDRLLPPIQTKGDAQSIPARRHRNYAAAAHVEVSFAGGRQGRGDFRRHPVSVDIEIG